MKNLGVLINFILLFAKIALCEDDDHTLVLSTKPLSNVTSKQLLDPIRKYTRDLFIIASINVDGQKSGLELDNQKLKELGLPNSTKYHEDCVTLHEVLNETFERIGFDFIESNKALSMVESGLWLYLPVLNFTSLDSFKDLFHKYTGSTNVTFLVTDCDLLKTKEKAKKVKEPETTKDEIRATPVIVQQTVVMLFFIIILSVGLYMALRIKTPSSLLVPQNVKPKIS